MLPTPLAEACRTDRDTTSALPEGRDVRDASRYKRPRVFVSQRSVG